MIGDERYPHIISRIPSDWGQWILCGGGWADLIIKLDADIAAIDPNYELHQCKEKMGGLRYYIGHNHEKCHMLVPPSTHDPQYYYPECEIDRLINEAEDRSFHICDVCGKPGGLTKDGFRYSTRCADHMEEDAKFHPWPQDVL